MLVLNQIKENINYLRLKQLFIRFLTSLSIFSVTVFFTPNFKIDSFSLLILSSISITILDYIMSVITGIHDLPLGRGIVGFSSAIFIIYLTQFIVSGYYISIFSSIIAASIYALIDYILPNKT